MKILYIGQYNEEGKFFTTQWKCFIEWCKAECNRVIVYSHMEHSVFCTKLSLYCNIDVMKKPDEALNIYAYEIVVLDNRFWNFIKEYDYNIDVEDDISHMYFFNGSKNIASLEIVDYENYIFIETPVKQENIFLLQKEMIKENIQFCINGKLDIDEEACEEEWEPLGNDQDFSTPKFQ